MKKNYITLMVGLFLLPTILSAQTFSISGQIIRHNGDPVPDIEVNCDGTATTDVDGNYEFTDVPLNHSCDLTASGMYDKFEDITILDIILLRQHILQINSIGILQILAADVNNSGSITTLDLVKLRQVALHMDNIISSDYKFVDANAILTQPFTNIPNFISLNVTDNITDADLYAIKKGDIGISSDYFPPPPTAPNPIFTISNESFQTGDDVEFEVTVEDFINILAIQNTLEWDPSLLEFQLIADAQGNDLVQNGSVNIEQIGDGLLPMIIDSPTPNPVSMNNGDILFTITFSALQDVPVAMTEVIKYSDQLTPKQIVWLNPDDSELYILEGEYMNGEGSTGIVNAPLGLELFEIFPNPIEDILNVKALLQDVEDFEISIVNVLGQNVYLEKFNQKELLLNIGISELPAGTYFLSLKTADGIQTESIVKK